MRPANIRKMTKKKVTVRAVHKEEPKATGVAKAAVAAKLESLVGRNRTYAAAFVADKAGVSTKTVYNLINETYDSISSVEAVAQVVKMEAWMLLCPASLQDIAFFLDVYNKAEPSDQAAIKEFLEMKRRKKEGGNDSH